MISATRTFLGVLLKDLPRYAFALRREGQAHLTVRNRSEKLESAPDSSGFRCVWNWTSELHAPKVIPLLGKHLMRRALAEHRIVRAEAPAGGSLDMPQVSFLIGHRGMSRLPHLLATLQSIAAQQGVGVECIVIEQDQHAVLASHLPPWVRLIHTPPPSLDMPYCRSWSFNIGARHARSPVLVLHDNDMLVPVDYASQILHRIKQGYEVVNLKRFIFYLSQSHSDAVITASASLLEAAPEVIVQNLEGGGSIAITRAGFERIGGMDESFIGWGGEDNDFWERAQLLQVWPWANLPIVHLWHASQPGKFDAEYETALHYKAMRQVSAAQRIRRLQGRRQGLLSGPAGWCESERE
jgi:hypothetical protein